MSCCLVVVWPKRKEKEKESLPCRAFDPACGAWVVTVLFLVTSVRPPSGVQVLKERRGGGAVDAQKMAQLE